jgi:hypothetical protein
MAPAIWATVDSRASVLICGHRTADLYKPCEERGGGESPHPDLRPPLFDRQVSNPLVGFHTAIVSDDIRYVDPSLFVRLAGNALVSSEGLGF